jgi:hypothetical protein
MSIWDSPEFNGSKRYVNFDVVGDSVSGTVTGLGIQNWSDGTAAPKIEIETESGEQIITAGQIRLKIALTEKRPEVGEYLSVTLTQREDRGNGKSLKHFDVIVNRLNS